MKTKIAATVAAIMLIAVVSFGFAAPSAWAATADAPKSTQAVVEHPHNGAQEPSSHESDKAASAEDDEKTERVDVPDIFDRPFVPTGPSGP